MANQTYKKDVDKKMAHEKMEKKNRMSMPMPKPKWTPQKGIPDQMKLKNIGVGWGGEMPKNIKIKK